MARKKKENDGETSTKKGGNTLTKAEEQVMQAVWKVGKGFAGDIANAVEEPRPAYRTVLTEIRILEQKGYVGHKDFNGNNQYYPLVSREAYKGRMLGTLMKNYFSSSYTSLVSFFLDGGEVTNEELEALSRIIEEKRKGKEGQQ